MHDLLYESFTGCVTKYYKSLQTIGSSVEAIAPMATRLCGPDYEDGKTYKQVLI